MSLARSCVNLGFIERPIFVGFIWGVISGDMKTALSLGAFYELFWLDLFPVGTWVPPNALFPMLCVCVIASTIPSPDATTLFLPVILTLPLGFFGAWLEKRHREWQAAGYNRLLRSFRTESGLDDAATLSVSISLLQLFSLNFIAFLCTTSAVAFAFDALAAWQRQPLTFARASWPLLWMFGAVGGLLALRIRRSYLVFGAGALCMAALALFGVIH